jgi:hypothetical protein
VKLLSQTLQNNFLEQRLSLFRNGNANTWPLAGTRGNAAFMLLKAIVAFLEDVKTSRGKAEDV